MDVGNWTPVELLGGAAALGGFIVCIGPVAQAVTIIRKRTSTAVSITNYSLVLYSSTLWTVYGIALGNYFLALPNFIDGVLTVFTISVALWFRRKPAGSALPETEKAGRAPE